MQLIVTAFAQSAAIRVGRFWQVLVWGPVFGCALRVRNKRESAIPHASHLLREVAQRPQPLAAALKHIINIYPEPPACGWLKAGLLRELWCHPRYGGAHRRPVLPRKGRARGRCVTHPDCIKIRFLFVVLGI
jgi:hypothetical protein